MTGWDIVGIVVIGVAIEIIGAIWILNYPEVRVVHDDDDLTHTQQ